GGQTVQEVVRVQDGVRDFVRDTVQVDVATSVNRVGADDIDTTVVEDHNGIRLILLSKEAHAVRAAIDSLPATDERFAGDFAAKIISIDMAGNEQSITSDRRERVVTAVVPVELDRNVLTLI